MAILIWTIVLFAVFAILALFSSIFLYKKSKEDEDHYYKSGKDVKTGNKSWFALLLIPFVWALLPICNSFVTINANEVGIVYDEMQGGIQTDTIGEGFHTKTIFQRITTISTANHSASISTYGQTSDGQSAQFQISIIYDIDKSNAGNFFRKTNATDISSEQLNTVVKQNLQTSTSQYNIFDLLSEGIETARVTFETNLKSSLASEYYITLSKASFDDVDAGDEVEAILKQKAEADQKIAIAEKEAEANLITAKNKAEITKTLADAEAYATKVNGQAAGEAANAYIKSVTNMVNTIYVNVNGIDESLVTKDENGYIVAFPKPSTEALTYSQCADIVLSIVFYNTWNGQLPNVLTSDSLSALIGSLISSSTTSGGTTAGTADPSSSSSSD